MAVPRAAAHNIADSLANEVSFIAGYYSPVALWQDVERQPNKELLIDLLSDQSGDIPCSDSTRQFIKHFRELVPGQFEREGCDPQQVTKFQILLRKGILHPISGREVIVTVATRRGGEAADLYVGCPLKRMQVIDPVGRRRRLRKQDARSSV